ncbi:MULTISPECIES: 3-oxoacyl-[acyl-carrier-protein] synthase III C-terminal domain-containing protein [unclassified Psychrobacillus]|uniref:type III polyketide synthase n=1 Tax=unclassified Psychrobacillus TaxID=2636677 RepID=UPI00146AB823|nr:MULTISPECIES: 3-oxoacyl-[acyl-carrier-protein] synthase III C-terminal domain-containing protein [unclassified Psychrobacillus]MCM3359313.1 type III polyketide synthase [Psychrobacillus sp. MER TA 171]NME06272.1 type III polyketide synthase [Psychrobacillus sp. BL-248-WT-3]
MPKIASVSTYKPPYSLEQSNIEQLTKELFQDKIPQLERLLKVFENGDIKSRNFCVPLEWHQTNHSFEERNSLYIELTTKYSVEVIQACLQNSSFLEKNVSPEEIDAIIFVSSTGISTPSIDARVMNHLPFSDRLKRIPLWGLGCAGGASGISRAFDYCKAHPSDKVLVVCVELCSLTFQPNDYSKSNLVGASLFADGAACVLVCGDDVEIGTKRPVPHIINTASKWMPDSEDVMGWEVKNSGLHVVFSKSIPTIISKWLGPFMHEFLSEEKITSEDIVNFVAHPGGKKVLKAYEDTLHLSEDQTATSREVLKNHGNMSSPTVLYVLEQFMLKESAPNDYGMLVALGPGFCGEAVLLNWRD